MIELHYIRRKLWYRGLEYSINETADWIEKHCPQAETTEEVLHYMALC